MIEIQNYIDGKLQPALDGSFLDNFNPATEEVYSQIPDSKNNDIDLAVKSAQKAFPLWSALSKKERVSYLIKIADLIKKNASELARAESIDNGKPISLSSSVDIPRAELNLRYFSEEVLEFGEKNYQDIGQGDNTTYFAPLGVVGVISPWNLPLYLFTWKIAPALALGCTVIAKPSEVTPMTAFLFSKLCIEAGLPAGVLNIVHGTGNNVGDAMTSHPEIKAVSFTGSSRTGKIIAKNCGANLKKYSLEMGGKNANIIFADCDFEKALKTTLRSSFANQGQICLCGSRIYIERPLYERFKNALIEKTNSLVQGDPLQETTQQGAVVSKEHFEKIMSYIEIAKSEGGTILCGGERFGDKGYFIQPTLIEGLSTNARCNQEEIFGPMACLIPFDSEEEVIEEANNSQYGLSCSIWTKDLERGERVAKKIEAGVLWVNTWMSRDLKTPFGGVKDSGRGREGGRYSLEFFSEIKNICLMRD